MNGQSAYYSDAADNLLHPDGGTAGAGVLLEAEFDHTIPREPSDGGFPGPTIFSNLQLTSPRYNSQKSNQLWVQADCTIGSYRAILQPTRGSLKRRGEDAVDARKRRRF